MARHFVPADAMNPPLVAICYQRCLLHTPGEHRREHDQPSPEICLTLSQSGTSLAGNNVQKIPLHRLHNRSSEKMGSRLASSPQPLSSFPFPFPFPLAPWLEMPRSCLLSPSLRPVTPDWHMHGQVISHIQHPPSTDITLPTDTHWPTPVLAQVH